jgi:hypothetical protein
MRNFKLLLFVVLSTAIYMSIYSCIKQDSKSETNISEDVSVRTTGQNFIGALQLPVGSAVTYTGGAIEFILPDGYFITGMTNFGNTYRSAAGKITCTCKEGSGNCTPTETDKTVGCNTEKSNPCLECVSKISTASMLLNEFFTEYYIEIPENIEIAIPPISETRQALDYDEWLNGSWLTMSEFNEYEQEIQSVIDFAYAKSGVDLEKLVDIPFFIHSKKVLIRIPYGSLESGCLYSPYVQDGDTGKTTCSGCDGRCVLETAYFGKVRVCVGCNSGCTLSW